MPGVIVARGRMAASTEAKERTATAAVRALVYMLAFEQTLEKADTAKNQSERNVRNVNEIVVARC